MGRREGKSIVFADVVIIVIFSVMVLEYSTEYTLFQNICFSLLIALAFVGLMMVKGIGILVQICASLIWTLSIFGIFPLKDWTNGSKIWMSVIAIILFSVFLMLHIDRISSLKKEMGIGQGSSKFENVDEIEEVRDNYTEINQKFTDTYNKCIKQLDFISDEEFTNFIKSCGSEYQKATNEFNSIFNSEKLFKGYDKNIRRCKDIITELNNLSLGMSAMYEDKIALKNSESRKSSNNHLSSNKGLDIDMTLFNGCKDKESITQRYRQLMKTFHPDTQNGDVEMTQKIQRTYEEVLKQL